MSVSTNTLERLRNEFVSFENNGPCYQKSKWKLQNFWQKKQFLNSQPPTSIVFF